MAAAPTVAVEEVAVACGQKLLTFLSGSHMASESCSDGSGWGRKCIARFHGSQLSAGRALCILFAIDRRVGAAWRLESSAPCP